MMANTGNREVELFSLSWEWPSEGTVLSVVRGVCILEDELLVPC